MEVIPREYKRNNVNFFSLSIADDQVKNFFGRDASSQTEVTEISDLQQMTAVIMQLVKDSRFLKRELILSRQSLEAEYASRLKEKADELYLRCNEKVSELEAIHEEKVSIIRRSFKQQLTDALISQSAHGMLNQPKPKEEKKKQAGKDKLLEMKLQVETLEKEIKALKEDIEMLNQENAELRRLLEQQATEPKISQEDIDKLEDQLAKERDKIRELEDQLSRSAGNTEALKATIDQQTEKINNLLTEKQGLEEKIEEMKAEIEREKENMRATIEKLQADFEKEKTEQIEKVKQEVREKLEIEFEAKMKQEKEELEKLRKEKEEMAHVFKMQLEARDKQHAAALSKFKKSERMLKTQLERAQKELEYSEKSWAKRLQILQDSNQAIREEVQTRSSMKRYVLKLKHAEVLYKTDDPRYYLPTPAPLPDIPPSGPISRSVTKERGKVTFQEDAESVTLSYNSDKPPSLEGRMEDGFDQGGEGSERYEGVVDKETAKILEEYFYLPTDPRLS